MAQDAGHTGRLATVGAVAGFVLAGGVSLLIHHDAVSALIAGIGVGVLVAFIALASGWTNRKTGPTPR